MYLIKVFDNWNIFVSVVTFLAQWLHAASIELQTGVTCQQNYPLFICEMFVQNCRHFWTLNVVNYWINQRITSSLVLTFFLNISSKFTQTKLTWIRCSESEDWLGNFLQLHWLTDELSMSPKWKKEKLNDSNLKTEWLRWQGSNNLTNTAARLSLPKIIEL